MRDEFEPTWIVVMDSSMARFYALKHDVNGDRCIEQADDTMESNLHGHAQDLKSDKPGRGFRAGNATARHSMEPPHDYHKLEKHDFVRAVAAHLKAAQNANKFVRLAVVAPDRSLGELRGELADTLKKALWREVPKDLVKLNDQDLWARLEPELHEELSSDA
jgi:protein required for attachment to host cells